MNDHSGAGRSGEKYRRAPRYQVEASADIPESTKLRRVAIKRVIDNLMENAFRYGSNNIQKSESGFDPNDPNVNLVFSAETLARGYPKSKIENLFQPFTQGRQSPRQSRLRSWDLPSSSELLTCITAVLTLT